MNIFSYLPFGKKAKTKRFFRYVRAGNIEEVTNILKANPFLAQARDDASNTALLLAVEHGQDALVKLLLDHGASLEDRDANGNTPLQRAIIFNHEELAIRIFDRGEEVALKNVDDISAFALALQHNMEAFAKHLIESGMDVNGLDEMGNPVFWHAFTNGHHSIFQCMVERGANVDAFNSEGMSLLHKVVHLLAKNDDAKKLLDHGASINLKNKFGETALSLAIDTLNTKLALFLLDRGADADSCNEDGTTPLLLAAAGMATCVDKEEYCKSKNLKRIAPTVCEYARRRNILNDDDQVAFDEIMEFFELYRLEAITGLEILIKRLADSCANIDCLVEYPAQVPWRSPVALTPLIALAHALQDQDECVSGLVDYLLARGAKIDIAINAERATSLHWAAACGNLDFTKKLLAKGAAINATDVLRETPLIKAIKEEFVAEKSFFIMNESESQPLKPDTSETIRFLLENNADTEIRSQNGATALHYAAQRNNTSAIQLLLDRHADTTAENNGGETPFHQAVYLGHLNTTAMLIEHGVDIEKRVTATSEVDGTSLNLTPLHIAIAQKHSDVARLLVEKGADIHARDHFQKTPLHIAADNGLDDIVRLLLRKGADLLAKDIDGATPEDWAFFGGHRQLAVDLLIEKRKKNGTDTASRAVPRAHGNKTKTLPFPNVKPIQLAILENRKYDVLKLLESGVGIETRNDGGETLLFIAAGDSTAEMVQLLLEHGADPKAKSKIGLTPFHAAVHAGNAAVAELLIDCGAKVNELNCFGDTMLYSATKTKNFDLILLLLRRGADVDALGTNHAQWTPLQWIADSSHVDIANLLMYYGANTDVRLDNGDTLLDLAVDSEMRKLFGQKRGVGTNIETLHRAADACALYAVRSLIEHGADVNATDNHGLTPLHYCAMKADIDINIEVIRFLIAHGANINAKSDSGRTPLDYAVNKSIVGKILLEAACVHSEIVSK